jgi:hypothetical protein
MINHRLQSATAHLKACCRAYGTHVANCTACQGACEPRLDHSKLCDTGRACFDECRASANTLAETEAATQITA